MKLAQVLGLVLVVAPLAVHAQSGAPGGIGVAGMEGPGGQMKSIAPPNPCPVGVSAQHLADGDMVNTGAHHSQGVGQRLHLTLTSPDSRRILSATVNVRGWTANGRMEQAGASNASLAVRTLQAPFTAGPDRRAWADLWAPGLTAVDSVELVSVAFADGSTWTPAASKSCRVAPDPLMPVAK